MVSFADFIFGMWEWIFPPLQWLLRLLISPVPDFVVDFIDEFGDVISWMGTITGVATAIPFVGLIFYFVSGLLELLQAGFVLLSSMLGEVPFIVVLIVLLVIGGIFSAISDWFIKSIESIKEGILGVVRLFLPFL